MLLTLNMFSLIAAAFVFDHALHSIYSISPTQNRAASANDSEPNSQEQSPGVQRERGQPQLLMPASVSNFGWCLAVTKHPSVRVPQVSQIGVVIAQVGQPLPIGAKSAVYKPQFGNFSDLHTFIEEWSKGVQRGRSISWHTGSDSSRRIPAFITSRRCFGEPISSDLSAR